MKKNKYLYNASIKICKHLIYGGYISGLILYSNDKKFVITSRQKQYMIEEGMISIVTRQSGFGYRLTPKGKQMIRDYNLSKLIN